MKAILAAAVALSMLSVGAASAAPYRHHHPRKVCSFHHHHRVCRWVR